jgi:hypothetical protein
LDIVAAQGKNKACIFIGPFDAIMRGGEDPKMGQAINDLIQAGASRGIAMGRVVGSGAMEDPAAIEEAMYQAIKLGARLICVHKMTTDLPFHGAQNVAEPFWRACTKAGF